MKENQYHNRSTPEQHSRKPGTQKKLKRQKLVFFFDHYL